MNEGPNKKWEGPIFILADDDQAAADRVTSLLYPELYFVITVTNPRHVLNFARRFNPHAIFLAEPLDFPKGGAATLLRRLIEEIGAPVIMLTEVWTPNVAAQWKNLGATDCLPHPTRIEQRLELMRAKMQSLVFADNPPSDPGQQVGRTSGTSGGDREQT